MHSNRALIATALSAVLAGAALCSWLAVASFRSAMADARAAADIEAALLALYKRCPPQLRTRDAGPQPAR